MTGEDYAALAAAGLQRWAEGRLTDVWALALVASRAAGVVGRAAMESGQPCGGRRLDQCVSALKAELRR